MPDATLKLPIDAADDALYHVGLLPLDRQAPAVLGNIGGTFPAVDDTTGALPPIQSPSQMGAPAGPPGSSDFASQKLAADTSSYKPWGQLGTLGKIGRVAGYAASALVPHVAGMIPETPLGHIAQINADTEQLRGAQQEERSQEQEKRMEETQQATAEAERQRGNLEQTQADVAKSNAERIPVTRTDPSTGQTITTYLREQDMGKYLSTLANDQTKFDVEKSKETAAQMLQSGRPVSMDQLAARATQEGDQATLQKIQQYKESIAKAGKQEPGSFIPVNDAQGNVVGFADPKSRDWVPVGSIAGGAVSQAAGGQGGSIPVKPTGQTESRNAQAAVVNRAADNLIADIEKHRDKLGNMEAIVNSAILNTPWADPETAELRAEITSFAALNPAMHGFRGAQALAQFEKILGGIPNNPDAMIAALRGIQKTTQAFNPSDNQTAGEGPANDPLKIRK